MSIGKKIKEQRKLKGLTQKELAEKTGISLSAIEKYERGRLNPSLGKVKEIAEALDVTIQELIVGDYVRTDKIQGVLEKDISIFSTKELIDELYRKSLINGGNICQS